MARKGSKREVLRSWKEISDYLGQSIKTCRRWEIELNLPVRRLEDTPKARVFAYPEELDQWVSRTEKSKGESIRIKKKRIRISTSAAVVVSGVMICTLLYFLYLRKDATGPSAVRSLAVMYFENHTGDANLDTWSRALPLGLIHSMQQLKSIRMVTADKMNAALEYLGLSQMKTYSPEDIRKVAKRTRAEYILLGYFFKTGDRVRIDFILKNTVDPELIGSKTVEGIGESTFLGAVDDALSWVKSCFDLKPSESEKAFTDIFTDSTEALKLYAEGRRLLQKQDYAGSIQALRKALEYDRELVLAYKLISESYAYLLDYEAAREYAERALSVIESDEARISSRDRYLVLGWAKALLAGSAARAIKTYEEMLDHYPHDEEALIYLGSSYRNCEEWHRAQQVFTKVLETSPEVAAPNLAMIYMAQGLYNEAYKFIGDHEHEYPRKSVFHLDLSLSHLYKKNFDFALIEIENALALEPESYRFKGFLGNIYRIKGNFRKAERIFRELINSSHPTSAIRGRLWLAQLLLSRGRYGSCKQEIVQAIKESGEHDIDLDIHALLFLSYVDLRINMLDEALHAADKAEKAAHKIESRRERMRAMNLRGLIQLEMKQFDEAKKTAEALRNIIAESEIPKFMRYYHHLAGRISEKENRMDDAKDHYERALQLHSFEFWPDADEQAFFLYPAALLEYEQGDPDTALEQFEKIKKLTTGRLGWGDIHANSCYFLGKIYEKKGWAGRAAAQYDAFLELWAHADQPTPEVADAGQRIAALTKDKY